MISFVLKYEIANSFDGELRRTLEAGFFDPAREAGFADAARDAGFVALDAGFTDALEAGLADALEAGLAAALDAGLVAAGLALDAGLV